LLIDPIDPLVARCISCIIAATEIGLHCNALHALHAARAFHLVNAASENIQSPRMAKTRRFSSPTKSRLPSFVTSPK
jgi:hypothetical protein